MSSGPENKFIKSVHDKLTKEIYREKMHNPYRGGTADVWYSGKRDVWVEYKWIQSVPKKGVLPNCSPLQIAWLNGRHKEGRTVYVVVGCPLGAIIFSNPAEWTDGVIAPVVISKSAYVAWLTGVVNGSTRKATKDSTQLQRGVQNRHRKSSAV